MECASHFHCNSLSRCRFSCQPFRVGSSLIADQRWSNNCFAFSWSLSPVIRLTHFFFLNHFFNNSFSFSHCCRFGASSQHYYFAYRCSLCNIPGPIPTRLLPVGPTLRRGRASTIVVPIGQKFFYYPFCPFRNGHRYLRKSKLLSSSF